VPLAVGESVRICANGNDNDLGGCETVTNGEEKGIY
jgi:hypothetical protein